MSSMANLLLKDVERLKKEPAGLIRADIVGKILVVFNQGGLEDKETLIVEEILRMIIKDTDSLVRKTVSERLKSNGKAPHDVVMALAKDAQEEVAVPVLEYSTVLSGQDLIDIIQSTQQLARLTAIARRSDVPAAVTNALVQTKRDQVVRTLLANDNALIPEESFENIIKMFPQSTAILQLMVERGGLPLPVVEKLLGMVSQRLKKRLVTSYNLPPQLAEENVNEGGEQSLLEVIHSRRNDTQSVRDLVDHLYDKKKLSSSLILRSLCKGDLLFFEISMAKLANIPFTNARRLIREGGEVGFSSLYRAAHIPETTMKAAATVLKLVLNEYRNGTLEMEGYTSRMINHIREIQYEEDIPLLDYMALLIDPNSSTHAAMMKDAGKAS